MRDFISKMTFGLLMAELFPGALLLFALSFFYFSLPPTVSPSLYQEVNVVIAAWETGSVLRSLVLLGLCFGAGLFIHGLQSAVAGALEARFGSAADSYWHDKPIWVQVIAGPVKIVREVIELLFLTKGVGAAATGAGVGTTDAAKIAGIEIAEDRYLHIGEFFVHTAYAIVFSFVALGTFMIFGGVSLRRLLLLVLIWLAAGLFFVLGRIQLQSMSRAVK